MISKRKSELSIITKAKDLSSYVFTITLKSPKFFRFSLVSKMHSLCLSIIENIIRANDVFLDINDFINIKIRNEYQNKALTDLKILSYLSLLAMEQKCIQLKHYNLISRLITDCQNLLIAWINSDKNRVNL